MIVAIWEPKNRVTASEYERKHHKAMTSFLIRPVGVDAQKLQSGDIKYVRLALGDNIISPEDLEALSADLGARKYLESGELKLVERSEDKPLEVNAATLAGLPRKKKMSALEEASLKA